MFSFWGLGFRFWGFRNLGFRVWGFRNLGFRVKGLPQVALHKYLQAKVHLGPRTQRLQNP